MVESGAFAASALAGGVLAGWTSARFTYFASLPFIACAVLAFARFDEPRLHRAAEPVALRSHIVTTFGAMIRQPRVRQVMLLSALAALVSTALFEFGPLWLVAQHAPAALFGPYWAALVSTLGLAGYLTSKLHLSRRTPLILLACAGPPAAAGLALSQSLAVVVVAQAALALILAIIGIHVGLLLHDSVPSTIRTAVSSGAGTLSWMLFLPFSLVFGRFAHAHGVQRSGWILAGAMLLVAVLLVLSAVRSAPQADYAVAEEATAPADLACRELVDLVTDYLDGVLPPDWRAGFDDHLADCAGCSEYVQQIRRTVEALHSLRPASSVTPAP
jgi:hypothetical protein